MAVKPIPDRCRSITPYLIVKEGAAAIEFYGRAFGAVEIYRMSGLDGKSVMHAEIKIGDSVVFLSEAMPGMHVAWPTGDQWPAATLHHYVEDADAAFKRAVDAGCTVSMPLADMFWGDRFGKVADPFGHQWSIAQHIEDVSSDEMEKRAAVMFGGG